MSNGKGYFRPWSTNDNDKCEKSHSSVTVFYVNDDLSSDCELPSSAGSLERLSSMVTGDQFNDEHHHNHHQEAINERSTVGSSPSSNSSCASLHESSYSAFTPTTFQWPSSSSSSSIERQHAEYLDQAYQAQLNYLSLPINIAGHYHAGMDEAMKLIQQDAAAKRMKKLRPKKFKCKDCPMRFSNNGQLCGHQRIHTGERPFCCDAENCGKKFTRNEELTRHKRIHTGHRPHSCDICGKSFGRKDHLKKHTRTHQNRGPYHLDTLSAFNLGHQIAPFLPVTSLAYNSIDPRFYNL